MLSIKNVYKYYKCEKKTIVGLDNISFNTSNSGIIFITGKSGSGKTTLLNVISRLDKYDSGDIIFDNISYNNSLNKNFDNIRNESIGFVFQEYNLIEYYSVYQNIELAINLQNKIAEEKNILEILEEVGLKGFQNRKINELSGGEKQRVAIARALIKKPKIILCDEPTGALDQETGEEILKLLKHLSKECLIIIASHDQSLVSKFADRVIKLEKGKIVSDSMPVLEYFNRINVKEKNNKFVKHKLHIKKKIEFSFKLLKRKKIRLFIALSLAVITLTLFSISSAIGNNDFNKLISTSMISNNEKYISYKKAIECSSEDGYTSIQYVNMSDEDIYRLSDELNLNELDIVYDKFETEIRNFNEEKLHNDPYRNSINGFIEIDESFIQKYDFKLFGNLPKKNNEVVITKFIFDMFCKYGYKRFDEEVKIVNQEDILNKTLWLMEPTLIDGGMDFKIVGIIDTMFENDRYDILWEEEQYLLESELSSILEYGIHNLVFLQKGYYDSNFYDIDNKTFECSEKGRIEFMDGFQIDDYFIINAKNDFQHDIYYNETYFVDNKKNISMILPISFFCTDLERYLKDTIYNYAKENFDNVKDEFLISNPIATNFSFYYDYIIKNNYNDNYTDKDYYYFRQEAIKLIIETYKIFDKFNAKITFNLLDVDTSRNVNILGVYDDLNNPECMIYSSDNLLEDIKSNEGYNFNKYKYVVLPFSDEKNVENKFLEVTNISFIDDYEHVKTNRGTYQKSNYKVLNEYVTNYDYNEGMLTIFQSIFKYLGIVLLVVVIFFIYYYFSGVVFEYRKNIGILRALGISKLGMLSIFMISSIFIALLIFSLSFLFTIIDVNLINNIYWNNNINLIKMITFSYREVIINFSISICSVFAGIFLPSFKIINKMPIDIIQEV